MPLPFVLLNLESVEKKGKQLKEIKHIENEKSFFDEIKKLIKNSGHKPQKQNLGAIR